MFRSDGWDLVSCLLWSCVWRSLRSRGTVYARKLPGYARPEYTTDWELRIVYLRMDSYIGVHDLRNYWTCWLHGMVKSQQNLTTRVHGSLYSTRSTARPTELRGHAIKWTAMEIAWWHPALVTDQLTQLYTEEGKLDGTTNTDLVLSPHSTAHSSQSVYRPFSTFTQTICVSRCTALIFPRKSTQTSGAV